MTAPLFSGTVHFVQVNFVTPTGTLAFSDADMATMIDYAQHAIVPITEMIAQDYGPASTQISPTALTYAATLSGSTFADSDLQGWVNDILSIHHLDPATSLIVVPCPTGISESSGEGIGANSGYHYVANGPYAVFGVYATNLTLSDQVDQYAMVVSHEIAEAIVDPQADHSNPEVGDPCCENCYHDSNFYRVYFDAFNNYLGTNQQTPPGGFEFAYYTASVVKPAGGGDCPAPDEDCNYAPTPQNFYFVAGKNNFGRDEVTDTLTWPTAFYLFLDGYSPAGIASSVPSLTGSFDSADIPGLSITHSSTTYDVGNTDSSAMQPQRIRFGYDISFTLASLSAFPAVGGAPKPYELDASISLQGAALPFSPRLEIFLLSGADPYFTNLRGNVGDYYLSQDIRVFSATPALNPVPISGPSAPQLADSVAGAYQYITDLVAYLNKQIGYLNSSYVPPDTNGFDPLDAMLPDQNGFLTADSTVSAKNGLFFNNYNFAVARVRLRGSSGMASAAKDVKVFFRLFTTQTFDTDFVNDAGALSTADPNITYPSVGGNAPTFPLPGTDGSGNINGCSLPFFATANYGDGPTDYDAGGVNRQSVEIPSGHDYAWAFFGCFLNVFDLGNTIGGQSIQYWTAASAHNCLVAQLASPDAPIVNANGVIENPDNSDKLAQRNLQITTSGNPGFPATHRVPQTLDVRPSPPAVASSGTEGEAAVLAYPDEIMFDWGEVPPDTTATLFWSGIRSQDVLALAASMYPGHSLSAVDADTIHWRVNSPVTYIPIPRGRGGSAPGLLTLQMPGSVHVGDVFDVNLRRLSTKRLGDFEPPEQPQREALVSRQPPVWRYVVGTFHMRVPVQHDRQIRPVDENLLAVLKWRQATIGGGNRWYPVLLRYIDVIEGRVSGMGGDPASIPASPDGYPNVPPAPPDRDDAGCLTGRVAELFFGRHGDFEGFVLELACDASHRFCSTEPKVRDLIKEAWANRYLISVCACRHDAHEVDRIVLVRAPERSCC